MIATAQIMYQLMVQILIRMASRGQSVTSNCVCCTQTQKKHRVEGMDEAVGHAPLAGNIVDLTLGLGVVQNELERRCQILHVPQLCHLYRNDLTLTSLAHS